jgi:hypothetical protein
MNTFASIAAALSLAAACAGADAQTVYACDSSEVWVRDMVGLVCESSNPSGHDASVGDPLGASMLTQRSAPAPVATGPILLAQVAAARTVLSDATLVAQASTTSVTVCLPDSRYNPEIGDKPSHCYFDQTEVGTADTKTLGEAVVHYDPTHYYDPALFSRADPLDGAVPVYR